MKKNWSFTGEHFLKARKKYEKPHNIRISGEGNVN